MKKTNHKFTIEFNLTIPDNCKLDRSCLSQFKKRLEQFVKEDEYETGENGMCFLLSSDNYERDIFPSNIKVKRS